MCPKHTTTPRPIPTCQFCGNSFPIPPHTPRSRPLTYCSRTCYRAAARERAITNFVPRFMSYVEKTESCWEWRGALSPKGYGLFNVFDNCEFAHRVAYRIANGEIPDDLRVLHRCDNPPCVNPSHLFLGTPADNTRDMMNKGRESRAERPTTRGAKNPASKLTDEVVIEIRHRYALGGIAQWELAIDYGITQTTVHNIVARKQWRHLE